MSATSLRFRLIGIAFAVLLSVAAQSQEPKFRQFTVKDGLPSATVYHALQDHRGYVWFSSEAGLTRFDGSRMTHWNMDSGLPDNEIFGTYEDRRQRLWLKCYNGKFAFLQHGQIHTAATDELLHRLTQNQWILNIHEAANGYLYFAMQRDGFSLLTPDNRVVIVTRSELAVKFAALPATPFHEQAGKKLSVLGFYEMPDGQIRVLANYGEFSFDPVKNTLAAVCAYAAERYRVQHIGQGEVIVTANRPHNALLRYTPQGVEAIAYPHIPAFASASPLLRDAAGTLWVGSLGNGFLGIGKDGLVGHFLKNESVSHFFIDNEGNQWATTLGNGVFMLPSNTVLTYTVASGLISNDLYAVTGDKKGNIYVGTVNGSINVLDPKGEIRLLKTAHRATRGYNRINDILTDAQGRIWAVSDLGVSVFGANIRYDHPNAKTLATDAAGNVYIGTSDNLARWSPNGSIINFWNERTMAIYPENPDFVWMGSNDGLHLYTGGEVLDINRENPNFQYRIADIDRTPDSILCICTSGNGIVLKDADKIRRLTTADGLIGNTCKSIFIASDGVVWVATNRGVSRFVVARATLAPQSLVNYTEADNLASNDVRGVFAHDGKVWVATSEGLSFFTEKDQKSTAVRPPIYLTHVKLWEKDTTLHPAYRLPHFQNNLEIGYSGISFKSGNRIVYQYRMVGLDKTWFTTAATSVRYPNLEHGGYTFEVKAINIDRQESEEVARVTFFILTPWWKTWWFRLLATLLLVAATGLVVFGIMENNRQKNQMRRQVVESEQMALRAQMNPHFIFNALNSIQHFITMEDEISANYYLSRFSKLVRQVLENSKRSFIYLAEEIETLRLYLELEMLRFEGKFQYTIHADPSLNSYDVEIPSMILQPFVENAIWHGLMGKQENPTLNIRFSKKEGMMVCEVEDNGIGRKASAERNKNRTGHQSTGISNTLKRLKLLSHLKDEHKLLQIIDKYDDQQQPAGTLVIINIPLTHPDNF